MRLDDLFWALLINYDVASQRLGYVDSNSVSSNMALNQYLPSPLTPSRPPVICVERRALCNGRCGRADKMECLICAHMAAMPACYI